MKRVLLAAVSAGAFGLSALCSLGAQTPFYFGNDLSYVNEMEDCGAVYRENDEVVDPFVSMATHGTNLVRVRLWNDPYWLELVPKLNENVKAQYSNLEDVTKAIRRSKEAGMDVILDFHFSDMWADPGRQVIPREWQHAAGDDDALAQLLYEYVKSVLVGLDEQGLMPEIVTLGNETNSGMLLEDELSVRELEGGFLEIEGGGTWRGGDERLSKLWNAGIRAVREVGAVASVNPKIALHVADPGDMMGFFDRMVRIGVTDFDIAGISYYFAWHGGSISHTGNLIRAFKTKYPQYDPMVLETGYPWDTANIDGLNNIIADVDPQYSPVSPNMQRKYMVDLTQEVIDAGGVGVIFWEPLWVSTDCRTPWGTGSSHEHVAYYNHRDNHNLHAGGTWMEAEYQNLPAVEGAEVSFNFDHESLKTQIVFNVNPGSEYQYDLSSDLRDWDVVDFFRPVESREVSVSLPSAAELPRFGRVWKIAR